MIKDIGFQAVRGGAVRLTLAANIAHDLGSLQESLKNLAEKLGHAACATGCDVFHIGMERQFVINSARELNPQPLPPIDASFSNNGRALPQDPIPVINVSVPAGVLNDIGKINKVAASVLGKLGCAACCSGFDIAFRRQLDDFKVDEKLNVERISNIG
jgi:hypothetical protein